MELGFLEESREAKGCLSQKLLTQWPARRFGGQPWGPIRVSANVSNEKKRLLFFVLVNVRVGL